MSVRTQSATVRRLGVRPPHLPDDRIDELVALAASFARLGRLRTPDARFSAANPASPETRQCSRLTVV